jgi:D-3-phosphoglycerate dehydrogenase
MLIVIAEDLWCPLPDWFTQHYEVVHDTSLALDREKLLHVAAGAQGLVVRNKTCVDRELLERLPHLQVVGRLGVGLDNIDVAACRERGMTVVAAKGCNAGAVAEYVLAGLFQHARFLSRCDEMTNQGIWHRQVCMGAELRVKTLGLVGVGDIGQRVAMRAQALGLLVVAYDPYLLPTHVLVQDGGVQLLSLHEVCQRADYLSLHVPLTPATRHLIGAREFGVMKESAVLINTARGGIVDEAALLQSLVQRPRRFAILDVREQEPPGAQDPFTTLDNVLLTPHIAGITQESSQRVADMVLGDVDRVLRGGTALGSV